MVYPSLQVSGSTTETYTSTGMLPHSTTGILPYSTTQTTFSTSCLYNDCHDYSSPAYPVYSITFTTTAMLAGLITTQTTVQGTTYNCVTSHWSNIVPPYAYLGSPENSTPTIIAVLALSFIAALSFALVELRRRPTSKLPTDTQPSIEEAPKVEVPAEPANGMPMFCRECGATTHHDSAFCEECGTKLTG